MQNEPSSPEMERFLAAWFAVRQLIQAANFNHFQKAGLSATQFMTLNLLPEGDESMSIGELARKLNLKPATVAKTVDSLEERKMVARERSATDKRRVMIKITDSGRSLQNAAAGQFRAYMGRLFQAMPTSRREALIGGLESLVRSAADQTTEPASTVTRSADGALPAGRNSRRSPRH